MKNNILLFFALSNFALFAQTDKDRVNPIIKDYGGIFEIPYAEERPDPNQEYKIVIEVREVKNKPEEVNWALNNVARMLNLHSVGGVAKEKMNVVLAIHGEAAYTVMNNEAYTKKYKVSNPNLDLYSSLEKAGVRIVVCGQSLIAREIDRTKLVPEVKIGVSMLTTLTNYQMKGYALLTF